MNHKQVMRRALEQLKINRTNFRKGPSKSICKMLAGGNDEVIADLESALAEPVQESVASFDEVWDAIDWDEWRMEPIRELVRMIHSKTAPPQRKPLTEEQKLDLVTNWFSEDWAIKNALGLLDDYDIERAHEICE